MFNIEERIEKKKVVSIKVQSKKRKKKKRTKNHVSKKPVSNNTHAMEIYWVKVKHCKYV